MTFPLGSADAYLQQLRKEDHKKSHFLHYANDEPLVRIGKAGGDGLLRLSPERGNQNVFPANGSVQTKPQWLGLDRVILRFSSYSLEGPVENCEEEIARIRYFEIFFYLEDDTIMIMERPDDRAEMKQGKLLNRQRVPHSHNPKHDLTVLDINVGKEVEIFSRTHFIYKCDPFTRDTMQNIGILVPGNSTPPFSQHLMDAESEKHLNHRLRRHISENQHMERFLRHDTEVLRFYAYWDDRERLFGDRHYLVIHYFLGDQTTEIVRKVPLAYGKDKLEPFVRRCKLPKHAKDFQKVDLGSPWPVLNIVYTNPKLPATSRLLFDQAQYDEPPETYTDVDFRCGETVNIFSRSVFVYDCDAYTKWYYKEIYGVDMIPVDVAEPEDPKPNAKPPPYNGYGTEEDSLKNCYMLVPKAPMLDVRKYLLLDWNTGDPEKLIFKLRMVTTNPKNTDREFIMSFALSDNSIYIYEKNVPQGVTAGTFHGKNAVKKGNEPVTDIPQYIAAEDLHVGREFECSKHPFIIAEVDECTASFMERYPDRFPFADPVKIRDKFRTILDELPEVEQCQLKQRLEAADTDGKGFVPWDAFMTTLTGIARSRLNPHEYLTLARHFKFHNPVEKERLKQLFRALIQNGFRLNAFDGMDKLKRAAVRADPDENGFLRQADFVRAIKACRAPINQAVLNLYLDVTTDPSDQLNYSEVLRDFDWINNSSKKLSDIPQNVSKTFDFEKFFGNVAPSVCYKNFLMNVTGIC